MFLRGVVAGRRKRVVGEREVELITYVLSSGHEVNAWAPKAYFRVGEAIEVPVSVKIYSTAAGPRWSLEIPADDGSF